MRKNDYMRKLIYMRAENDDRVAVIVFAWKRYFYHFKDCAYVYITFLLKCVK